MKRRSFCTGENSWKHAILCCGRTCCGRRGSGKRSWTPLHRPAQRRRPAGPREIGEELRRVREALARLEREE